MTPRAILHVDMDAFFAAIEILDDPSLQGLPLLVGSSAERRGVVATASYEARAFGIHSAMPMATALRLCPQAVLRPARHERYSQMSDRVMAILGAFTPLLEPVSVDEAYLDVTGSGALFGSPETIARRIKERIRSETGLTCSVGVAAAKVCAKIASDLHKPDGLTVVPADAAAFLAPLPVRRIPGVGPKSAETLARLGIRTIGDLARAPTDQLARRLGSYAGELQDLARGVDPRPIVTGREAKGMSRESTFSEFLRTREEAETALLALADDVGERLRADRLTAGVVILKVRDEKFLTRTRTRTLDQPTDLGDTLYRTATELLAGVDLGGRRIRLLGVGAHDLRDADSGQLALFSDKKLQKTRTIAGTVDRIRSKHGEQSVIRGALLKGRKVTRGGWEGA